MTAAAKRHRSGSERRRVVRRSVKMLPEQWAAIEADAEATGHRSLVSYLHTAVSVYRHVRARNGAAATCDVCGAAVAGDGCGTCGTE